MKPSFQMIDVGNKPIKHRNAVASGEIVVGAETFAMIRDRKLPNGDVLMLAQREGCIVNISSIFGLISFPTQGAYNMSKFAVRGLTECL